MKFSESICTYIQIVPILMYIYTNTTYIQVTKHLQEDLGRRKENKFHISIWVYGKGKIRKKYKNKHIFPRKITFCDCSKELIFSPEESNKKYNEQISKQFKKETLWVKTHNSLQLMFLVICFFIPSFLPLYYDHHQNAL